MDGSGERINLMFRAFSDRTRMRILHLIQDHEMCVGDLFRILRVPQPTASRHLAYLRRAGLVKARRDGSRTYYSLAPARIAFHRHLIECLRSSLRLVPEMAGDAARACALKQSGPGAVSRRSRSQVPRNRDLGPNSL